MKMLMAANWKMFKTRPQAVDTLRELLKNLANLPADREAALFAPFTLLPDCAALLADGAPLALGGQNCYPAEQGAFTGEISPAMLKDCGCSLVLAGHSERRALFGESDEFVGQKCAFALASGLNVVLCIGETLEERDQGNLPLVLQRQLAAGLADVLADVPPASLSVAYEPVWAIGTGRVAGPAEILEAHALIRDFLVRRFPVQGKEMRILYGGSVKPDNAAEIIGLDNVNGVLVGGASLQAESFSRIVLAGSISG
ncbi:triose-phosphate isomerase [Desulfovibrio sp. OttesenSCG-928-M16]|nr:triose-phosphate isomerase [Desulfovibrio sp. OttesenSCG-928-M16]